MIRCPYLVRTAAALAAAAVLAAATAAQCPVQTVSVPGQSAFAVDGDVMVVTEVEFYGDSPNLAHVYRRSGSTWSFEQTLIPSDPTYHCGTVCDPCLTDAYGATVAVDGDVLVVGSPWHDDLEGLVYVYRWNGSTWAEETRLEASGAFGYGDCFVWGSQFGCSLAVSGDYVLAGSFADGASDYRVHAFHRVAGVWVEEDVFEPSSPAFCGDYIYFGFDTIDIDGDRAVLGAPWDDLDAAAEGRAFVFERSGTTWIETAMLQASTPILAGHFGSAVAIDGDRLLIGAPGYAVPPTPTNGSAELFRWDGAAWTSEAVLTAFDEDPAVEDLYGIDVDLKGDLALVGSSYKLVSDGSSYLYRRQGSDWLLQQKLPAVGTVSPTYGSQVGLTGNQAIVASSGAKLVFEMGATTCELSVDTSTISLSAGGSQSFTLDLGPGFAGQLYKILGTFSGTSPGTVLPGGITILLNSDSYYGYTLASASPPPMTGGFGVLDASGKATASIDVPPGTSPGMAGIVAWHAFAAVDLTALVALEASNPVPLVLVP
ncbi:MAG: hypothetical protein O7B99_05820 [Planctomycetota bacterium]|nr:hypothetical protein [Planctomycetota bacterium]